MKKMIIASTSTLYGSGYLEYLMPTLKSHFKNCKQLLFIPYARPDGLSHAAYTKKVFDSLSNLLQIEVKGIHEFENAAQAIENAQAIFVGGGNTFVLVNEMYRNKLWDVLERKIKEGIPYLGTSAGSNICGLTISTTNDMPIVYPPSFKTLGLVSFNINPHYLDADATSKHMGETRETRISEFHCYNSQPVIGLREGSWLLVSNESVVLKGNLTARWFQKNKLPIEIEPETELKEIM